MTVNELIEKLQKIQCKYGESEVLCYNSTHQDEFNIESVVIVDNQIVLELII